MTNHAQILCPWCGAEMYATSAYHEAMWTGQMTCMECGANGPRVRSLCGDETVLGKARAAALRRYTPPIKPMTLERLRGAALNVDGIAWLEVRDVPREEWEAYYKPNLAMRVDRTEYFQLYYIGSLYPYMPETTDYGKKWRCWERKPTDEERSAAEWEK